MSSKPSDSPSLSGHPGWMTLVLRIAGSYNIAWGTVVVLFPNLIFQWSKMEPLNHPEIWQCVGMIVGVYGVGYLIAGQDPIRHWPMVFVGLLGKVLGPIGMASALVRTTVTPLFALNCVTNDLIWWVPFGMILARAHAAHSNDR